MTKQGKDATKAAPQKSHRPAAITDLAPHYEQTSDGDRAHSPPSVAERVFTHSMAVSSVVVTFGAAILYLIGAVGYPAYVDELGVPTGPFGLDAEMLIVWGLHIGALVLAEAIFAIAAIIAVVGAILIPLWRWLDGGPASTPSRRKPLARQSWQSRYAAPMMLHLSIVMTLLGTSIFAVLCISLVSGTSTRKGRELAIEEIDQAFSACALENPCQTYAFSDEVFVGRALLSNERLMAVAVPSSESIVILDLEAVGQRLMSIELGSGGRPASERSTVQLELGASQSEGVTR